MRIFLGAIIFMLFSCAEHDNQQVEIDTFSNVYKPTLYSFEYNGKTSYLFGTIHSGTADMYPLPKYVDNAIKQSEAFVFEINISETETEQFEKAYSDLINTHNKPLHSYLAERTLKAVKAQCLDENAICESDLLQEPWFTALVLASKQNAGSGLKSIYGVEVMLMMKIGDRPLYSLENTIEQIQYLDKIPLEVQDLLVFSALSEPEVSLVNSWKLGQIPRYMTIEDEHLLNQGLSLSEIKELRKYTLYERNEAMAIRLLEHLKKNQSLFVALGAAHLFGRYSIVEYLEEQGITVNDITPMQ